MEGLAWLRDLSPFFWFDSTSTLRDGIDLAKTLLLVGVSILFIAVRAIAFNRRDVGV